MGSHCQFLLAPADGDVAQLLVIAGLTRSAQHKAVTSPPGYCRFVGPDLKESLQKHKDDSVSVRE